MFFIYVQSFRDVFHGFLDVLRVRYINKGCPILARGRRWRHFDSYSRWRQDCRIDYSGGNHGCHGSGKQRLHIGYGCLGDVSGKVIQKRLCRCDGDIETAGIHHVHGAGGHGDSSSTNGGTCRVCVKRNGIRTSRYRCFRIVGCYNSAAGNV